MTLDMWDETTDALCAHEFKVLRYDMYGHGQSSCSPSIVFDLGTFVQQLDELLTALLPEEQSVQLIGFSLGGLVALDFASNPNLARKRVESLVLVDSCGLQGKMRTASVYKRLMARLQHQSYPSAVPVPTLQRGFIGV